MVVHPHHYHLSDEPKYRCFCNRCHVEKGAYIIAFVGAILTGLAAIAHFITFDWPMTIIYLISLFTFLSIIWAQKRRNPNLYLPFLIINGIGLVLAIINLILLILAIIFKPDFYADYVRDTYDSVSGEHHPREKRDGVVYFVLALSILIAAITLALYAWFYIIVFRAYQYMKDVQTVNVTSIPVSGGVGIQHGVIPPPGPTETYKSTVVQQHEEVLQKV